MGIWHRRLIILVFSTWLLWPICSIAQEQTTSEQSSASTTKQKRVQKGDRSNLLRNLDLPMAPWLRDEVPDIITEDERRAFRGLSTNEEREQFIEIFWNRRNPEPESPTNAFSEEHYRRLAYADEHFASGIPGRKTDRGRIYLIWGRPDEMESHPAGGTYDRPLEQGGGSTTTYPWELWRYRHLEGIGENIEIEFVDPSGSGDTT